MSRYRLLSLALVLTVAALAPAQSALYYQPHFPPEEFRGRWDRILDRIGPTGAAIVQGMPKVNGFIFPRQNNEFYYLTGIEAPHAYLILDGKRRKATLFLPPRDVSPARAERKILAADESELVQQRGGVT